MPLIYVVLILIVIGVLLWLVNTYIPMPPTIKMIINVLVIIVIVLWILQVFGLLQMITSIRVGHR